MEFSGSLMRNKEEHAGRQTGGAQRQIGASLPCANLCGGIGRRARWQHRMAGAARAMDGRGNTLTYEIKYSGLSPQHSMVLQPAIKGYLKAFQVAFIYSGLKPKCCGVGPPWRTAVRPAPPTALYRFYLNPP